MQGNSPAFPHTFFDFLYVLAIPVAGGVGALVTRLLNRKKLQPEVLILEARAGKTRAETRKLDGETITNAWERIDELQEINFQLRIERDEWKQKADKRAIQRDLDERQIRKMKAILGNNILD